MSFWGWLSIIFWIVVFAYLLFGRRAPRSGREHFYNELEHLYRIWPFLGKKPPRD